MVGSPAGFGPESFGAPRAVPASTARQLERGHRAVRPRRSLSQPPSGRHHTVVGGPLRTGRGSPCVRGGVCFHMSVEMVSEHRPVCICGRASSCGGPGGSSLAHVEGGCAGSAPPHRYLVLLSDFARAFGPLAHLRAPAWWASPGQGRVWQCLPCGLPFWVGPAGGGSLPGKELLRSGPGHSKTVALLTSAPRSFKGLSAGAGLSSMSPPRYLVTFVCALVSPP